ncbi:hypothetical protein [Nocardioides sp. 503]|uniref:hypothetical protein n=1 Tax=Nocardioides sp. 503 TaxID=2508326 RepID=UPI00106FAC26|nr:hypothetical protein [Nocardioides sp. 503]
MNDVRTLFESVVVDAPPDTLDLDQVVARGTRRRTVRRAVTAGAGLAAALVIGSGIAYVATPDDDRTAPPVGDPTTGVTSAPTVIDLSARPSMDLSCENNGMELSPPKVIAQPSGVVVRLSSTMKPGSSFGYSYELPFADTGAHRLPARDGTWRLPLAPGKVTLACQVRGEKPQELVLNVVDPDGQWMGDTLEGCDPVGTPEWGPALTGTGPSTQDAIEVTLNGLRARDDGRPADEVADYAAQSAGGGYNDLGTGSWVVLRNGEPYLTLAMAIRGETQFVAMPDQLCG